MTATPSPLAPSPKISQYWRDKGKAGSAARKAAHSGEVADLVPCRYCRRLFRKGNGLRNHENHCCGDLPIHHVGGGCLNTDSCDCGDKKLSSFARCWKCAWRGPRLRELDRILGLTGWHGVESASEGALEMAEDPAEAGSACEIRRIRP